jgi:uncharacterized protein YbjQ (UPF0145 family)
MSDNDEDKPDLTRIEDLSEFLHQEDSSVDELLSTYKDEGSNTDSTDDESLPQIPNDFSEELEEDSFSEFQADDENLEDSESESWQTEEEDTEEAGDLSFSLTEEAHDEPLEFGDQNEEFDSSEEFQAPEEESEDDSFDSELEFAHESEENDLFEEETEVEEEEELSLPEEESYEEESEVTEFADEGSQDFAEQDYEPEPEPTPEPEPLPASAQEITTPSPRENFADVKSFSESTRYNNIAIGGNPPFSIIVRNILYTEDADDIFNTLKEYGLISADNEEIMRQNLESGSILVSQISEYSAIFIAHKLRRFHCDVLVGLSEQLHPSKSYQQDSKGLISKDNIRQNKKLSQSFEKEEITIEDVILSTTTNLHNYRVIEHIGIVTDHMSINENELDKGEYEASSSLSDKDDLKRSEKNNLQFYTAEQDRAAIDALNPSLNSIYSKLSENLKHRAVQLGGNAVIGVNYQLTPISPDQVTHLQKYKVTCSGSVVWAVIDD